MHSLRRRDSRTRYTVYLESRLVVVVEDRRCWSRHRAFPAGAKRFIRSSGETRRAVANFYERISFSFLFQVSFRHERGNGVKKKRRRSWRTWLQAFNSRLPFRFPSVISFTVAGESSLMSRSTDLRDARKLMRSFVIRWKPRGMGSWVGYWTRDLF